MTTPGNHRKPSRIKRRIIRREFGPTSTGVDENKDRAQGDQQDAELRRLIIKAACHRAGVFVPAERTELVRARLETVT
jgi:hypothetical protein